MKLSDHYNCIVLGDHPSSLLSGALAAKLGLSVLMLPMGKSQKLSVAKTGQFLDFETNWMTGFNSDSSLNDKKGLLLDCLVQLGLQVADVATLVERTELPQVLTPHVRVHLSKDSSAWASELNREFGKLHVAEKFIGDYFQNVEKQFTQYGIDLPKRLQLAAEEQKKPLYKKIFNRKFDPEPILNSPGKSEKAIGNFPWIWEENTSATRNCKSKELISGLTFGNSGNYSDRFEALDAVQLLVLARTAVRFRGGLTAYRDLLIRLAKRFGAHTSEGLECSRIFFESGKFIGVQVANRGNMISADGAIAGCGLNLLREKISASKSNLRKFKNSPKSVGWKFTLSVKVQLSAIPVGANSRLIWQEADAPPMEIEIVNPQELGAKDSEHRLLFLRTVMPFRAESLEIDFQRKVAARMLRLLSEIMPFVEYHISSIYPNYREYFVGEESENQEVLDESFASPKLEDELLQLYPFKTLAEIPENLRSYDSQGTGAHSGIEGLFVGSGEAYPRLGSFGGTLSALEFTAWLANRSGLSGPLV